MPRVVPLSFDELLPGLTHELVDVRPTVYGYRSQCRCGWISQEIDTRAHARGAYRSHVCRTPQGEKLVRTFRKPRQSR